MPNPGTQSTNPHPEGFLRARLAGLSGQVASSSPNRPGPVHPKSPGISASRVAVEEPEQLQDLLEHPHTGGCLQTWLAEISPGTPPDYPRSLPTSYLITQSTHPKSDAVGKPQDPKQLGEDPQEELGLDFLGLQCDPRLRLIFYHPNGNPAI
ncbi:hypothetical protein VM1G_11172 [Cytospora mali]|uniref:Uncharacterized protein n=1 Tax=Cytospora mali TaxID=578113 RepID=A0A194VK83_CYTMA|nr:hypothetical protein VM1G_11172 [Valsa mali]